MGLYGFQVFVQRLPTVGLFGRTVGSSIVVFCYPADTVATLKWQVQFSTGVPVDAQILMFLGVALIDELLLTACHVGHGDFIHMTSRLRGGVVAPASPGTLTTPLSSATSASVRAALKRAMDTPVPDDGRA